MSVNTVSVIQVILVTGDGSTADPFRNITQYWSTDGELLASRDAWKEEAKGAANE